ncbi:phage tail tip lysozyme [Frigidibacter oleivorans]|uniref:phage tail tip lysozyme n=1 Tax=Frigidibacter oleivorans TaxID=2487129 RepID=UPI000F8F51F9|nr:phage tail tip lysozyme [Frigidibacter oleivorans]
MAGEINISVLIRLAAEQARREAAALGGDVKALGTAAEEAGRKTSAAGAAIDRAGAAAQTAASGIAAMTQPITQMVGAMTAAETVMQRQVAAFAGIKTASEGAFAAQLRHGAMLDELKARFNPLFAASRDYELQLHGIAEAERLGAISAQEAAAARSRAALALTPFTAGLGQFGDASRAAAAHAANLSFQMNDIFMMTAVGQSPWMLMMQQGPQVVQIMGQMRGQGVSLGAALTGALGMVLNPVGLLTLGMIGLGAAGVQALSRLGGETRSFDDELKDLNGTLARMRGNLDLLGTVRLEDTFGSLTGSVRGLAQGMLDLDRAAELKQLGDVIDGFLDRDIEESFLQLTARSLAIGTIGGMGGALSFPEESSRIANYSALGAANSLDDFEKRTAEIKALAEAGDIEAVTEQLLALQAAMAGGGSFTGMTKELRELWGALSSAAIDAAKFEAVLNGTAQANAITHQIDRMVQGYTQQLELAEASLRYGENSVEVEGIRARQAREALRIRLEDMKVQQGSAEELRAYAALNAKLNADADAAQARRQKAQTEVFADLGRQQELSTAILQFGEDSAEVEAVRARHAWDVQAARLAEMGLGPQLIAMAQALFQAERDRANAIRQGAADKRGQDLLADLREEAAIGQAILIHGEDSLRVKELQIAADRRAFEQQLATMRISEEMKTHLREAWEAARGLASADPFGRIAAGNSYLADQQERIDKLRLEQSLLGQNEAIQRRTIALWEVERDLRREGIDLTSARAAEIRAAAMQEFELTRSIERQTAAWQDVQSSAESAIDGIVEQLKGGDIIGALEAVADELSDVFTELAVTNPLKNAILGTNYGTMQDVGGLQGIWGRLTGQAPELTATASSMGVGSMNVTAATVVLNGSIAGMLGSPMAAMGATGIGAANVAAAPSMSGEIQRQIWEFFGGKGLAPHQIAGIMGNVQGESGFNPLAVGDNGTSYGLFQHHAERGAGLLGSLGGMSGLGNVQGQLEYVWQELMSSEKEALQKLLSSTDVAGATSAWMTGFERPSDAAMAESWPSRLAAAEAAMTTFTGATGEATAGLGTLGSGFDAFGSALANMLTGGAGAEGLFGTIFGALGIPGFAVGGVHAGGLRIVGENGPELEYTGPSTILPADLTRSILGAPSPAARQPAAGGGPMRVSFNLVNNSGVPIEAEGEATIDETGGITVEARLNKAVAQAVSQRGGPTDKALRSRGAKAQTWRRS